MKCQAGWRTQAEIKIGWRNINNLRYADVTTLMAESGEELKRQVKLSGIPIFWRIFHTLLWSTQWKTLALPMKKMFFGNTLVFLYDPTNVGNLISGSSGFTKFSLKIRKFSVHVWLKPSLKDFEHYLAGMWDEYNCVAVPTIFGIALLWDWNENWTFPVLWTLLNFPNVLAYWVQYFNGIIF